MSTREFEKIKESEILSMLKPDREYLVDDNGNYFLDKHGDPILNPLSPEPKIVSIGAKNMFGPLEFKDRVSEDVIDGFQDVYDIDDQFLDREAYTPGGKLHNYNVRFLAAYEKGVYQGGVWTFNRLGDNQFLGLYGIRSSMANVVTGKRGVARALLEHVENLGSFKNVIIPWPLQSMVPLLNKTGYLEVNSRASTPERQFLAPVTGTSNYWIKNVQA